jgi:hypothetical protein
MNINQKNPNHGVSIAAVGAPACCARPLEGLLPLGNPSPDFSSFQISNLKFEISHSLIITIITGVTQCH